jgi:hypothetical protein
MFFVALDLFSIKRVFADIANIHMLWASMEWVKLRFTVDRPNLSSRRHAGFDLAFQSAV